MGPYAASFRLRAAQAHLSVLIVMSVAGTLTPNAKSRTDLFTPTFPATTHTPPIIPYAFPFDYNGKKG